MNSLKFPEAKSIGKLKWLNQQFVNDQLMTLSSFVSCIFLTTNFYSDWFALKPYPLLEAWPMFLREKKTTA